jgi:cytoskeletal protein CcmA (bactofilin family)
MSDAPKGFHTLIGSGTIIKGEIIVDHDLRVDGQIEGKIKSTGALVVGESGHIEAEVEVKSAKISGTLTGNLTATEKIELEEKAVLTGDIRTRNLTINEGALFHGNCAMQQK